MSVPIPLTKRRFARRSAARLSIEGSTVVLSAAYFSRKGSWQIPLTEVGVTQVSRSTVAICSSVVGWAFQKDIAIPQLTPDTAGVNIRLLFRHPQRLPRVKFGFGSYLDVSPLNSRREHGVLVDGVLLSAIDPAVAVAQLVAHGAEPVEWGTSWLRSHRGSTTDPAHVHQVRANAKRHRRVKSIVGVTWFLITTWALVAGQRGSLIPWWEWIPLAPAALIIVGLPAWSRRRSRVSARSSTPQQ